jgi:hypothetical protein
MFSVIIPTMWRSDRTLPMLQKLNDCDHVSEIILIDNDTTATPDLTFEKLVYIPQLANIYVNPAWNLGVKSSKENLICILNDDISFDVDKVMWNMSFVTKDLGCIGLDHMSFNYGGDEVLIARGDDIGKGWGCALWLDKDRWKDIPEGLKIWYGDNWIADNYEDRYKVVFDAETEMSTTSGDKALSDVIKNDIEQWKKMSLAI